MKLASLKSNNRDGELCVVDARLQKLVKVPQIAGTLQLALDHWHVTAPQLKAVYQALNEGSLDSQSMAFDSQLMASPLPRAYQWADGSAYVNHVELVRKARGAELPANFWTDPLMYQGGSDSFLAPNEDILAQSTDYGIDYEAEVAVITDDVPMGVSIKDAEQHIQLILLVNDVSLRNLIPEELAKGFGFFQSKPSSSFSPVALTFDELKQYWRDAKLHLPLRSYLNGQLLGKPNAGVDMTFSFAELIAHAAKTRPLGAGTIIGSGTVSNCDRSHGSSCLAEKRMLEILEHGKPVTPYLQFGDTVRIEMLDEQGLSLFGAIEQSIKKAN